jgi:CRP/FNR family transcriptional regulator
MQEASWPRVVGGSKIASWLAGPAAVGERREIPGPQTLYQPHERADHAFFLESGQVRIYQTGTGGLERLADILGRESWFGISALAQLPTYGSRAEVVSRSVVWMVPAVRLLQRMFTESEVAASLVSQLAGRLRAAHDAAARLMFEDTNQRLLRTLVEFSKTSAATPHEDGVLLRITHQQLAQAVGAARETVSLALTQLRQRSLLRTGRNRLMFNPIALREFSERVGEGMDRPDSPATLAAGSDDVDSGN